MIEQLNAGICAKEVRTCIFDFDGTLSLMVADQAETSQGGVILAGDR
jgi:trehalose-6-phosphatase